MASKSFYHDIDLKGNEVKSFGFDRLATFPATPFAGQIFTLISTNVPYIWDGACWKKMVNEPTSWLDPVRGANLEGIDNLDTLWGDGYSYSVGTLGEGATIVQNNPLNGSLEIDGIISWNVGDRVLIGNEPNSAYNGVYTVTDAGDGATLRVILTRATDNDTADEIFNAPVVLVKEGDTFYNKMYHQVRDSGTVGTSAIQWEYYPEVVVGMEDYIITAGRNTNVTFSADLRAPERNFTNIVPYVLPRNQRFNFLTLVVASPRTFADNWSIEVLVNDVVVTSISTSLGQDFRTNFFSTGFFGIEVNKNDRIRFRTNYTSGVIPRPRVILSLKDR